MVSEQNIELAVDALLIALSIGIPSRALNLEFADTLRNLVEERKKLRRLLHDIHPDPDFETVEEYYEYFAAHPFTGE